MIRENSLVQRTINLYPPDRHGLNVWYFYQFLGHQQVATGSTAFRPGLAGIWLRATWARAAAPAYCKASTAL